MNLTALKRRIGGFALMVAMMGVINIATTESVHAQWRNDRYDNTVRWPIQRMRQYAQMLGYHNAYSEGKEAAANGFRGSYRDMPGYRNSINGWLAWMGDANAYRDSYRRGYAEGFRDGQTGRNRRYRRADVERVLGGRMKDVYGGNDEDYDDNRWQRGRGQGGWGRGDGWGRGNDGRFDRNEVLRIAQQNGYREGARHGQDDRARRRSFNYEDAREYRDASEGYRFEYGDRGLYQQGFRDGYRRGYEDAYRGRSTSNPRWPF
jgi:hypothetical protein